MVEVEKANTRGMKYMITLHIIVIDSLLVARKERENTILEVALIYATYMIQYYIIGQYTVDNPYLPANSAMLSP